MPIIINCIFLGISFVFEYTFGRNNFFYKSHFDCNNKYAKSSHCNNTLSIQTTVQV